MSSIFSVRRVTLTHNRRNGKYPELRRISSFVLWLAISCRLVAVPLEPSSLSPDRVFKQLNSDAPENFGAIPKSHRFEVLNPSGSNLLLEFEFSPDAEIIPRILRIGPGGHQEVKMELRHEVHTFVVKYLTALSAQAFETHDNRYRAYSDGETVMCVPVPEAAFFALRARTSAILKDSTIELTDTEMPPGTVIYTPGPFYRTAGLFARDFLFQLEGSGKYLVAANEVRDAVDLLALKQLKENRMVGAFTYPKGSIPDHIYPDGRYCWGPGRFYGDDTAHFHRPSMDEAFCFVILGWHYGYKSGWSAEWRGWFEQRAKRFVDAWNSAPINPETGLVTQWSTQGHTGANGIAETNGSCVMWGFHDSYGFGGDDIGCSILACNAAHAMADMYDHSGHALEAKTWADRGDQMGEHVRAQFNPKGYLPWGRGANAPTMASPDYTGYAVWSGILTPAQADAASDWFAERYSADLAAGGAADMFNMAEPFRGSVRMARKADDVSPGRHVWPDMRDGTNWENLTYGYNAYQDGGYWYYKCLGMAVALWRKHPDLASEWVGNAYSDLARSDLHAPYERIDGLTPVNDRYNASVGQLMGMGIPAEVHSIRVGQVGSE